MARFRDLLGCNSRKEKKWGEAAVGANDLNVSEITGIFKESLNVQPSLKAISGIFKNKRFRSKVNYSPSFQRNYVWDESKATYFIESIVLGTEIPPLVLFKDGEGYEVIDGRQRYETILRFMDDKFALHPDSLKRLDWLSGHKYSDLSDDVQNAFDDTKLRLLTFSVVNEPTMTGPQKDKVKREIFNRYNSGITSLKPDEVERAEFESDKGTSYFYRPLTSDSLFLEQCEKLFGNPKGGKKEVRDRSNALLSRIRTLLVMPYVPIRSYAYGKRADIVACYYFEKIAKQQPEPLFEMFCERVSLLKQFQDRLDEKSVLKGNRLVNEVLFWAFCIVAKKTGLKCNIELSDVTRFLRDADQNEKIWTDVPSGYWGMEKAFASSGSHFGKAIIARYSLMAKCISELSGIDFSKSLDDRDGFREVFSQKRRNGMNDPLRLTKPDPYSESIDDVLEKIAKNRFLIRPAYQRSEVCDTSKASYLIESIMLGIKIPPIFVFKRNNNVFEVVDGQQRLLSIIGFLGRCFIDERGEECRSRKNGFALKRLRILSELNGFTCERLQEEYPGYYEKILDFSIDVIEISESLNPSFSPIDLFRRLNEKPYPIKSNSFEMWNSYIDRRIADRAKEIVSCNPGAFFLKKNNRMKNEELVTILAYSAYRSWRENREICDCFAIYVREGKAHVRVKDRNNVTKVIDAASESDVARFLEALDLVSDFLEKLRFLVGADFEELNRLVSLEPNLRKSRLTNKEAYILWILLVSADLNGMKKRGPEIVEFVHRVFESIREVDSGFDLVAFFEQRASELEASCSNV